MPLVKGPFFIKGVMKFVTGDPSITGTIQMADKAINQVEKIIFVSIVMKPVQPIDPVTSYAVIIIHRRVVTDTCRKKQIIGIKRFDVIG